MKRAKKLTKRERKELERGPDYRPPEIRQPAAIDPSAWLAQENISVTPSQLKLMQRLAVDPGLRQRFLKLQAMGKIAPGKCPAEVTPLIQALRDRLVPGAALKYLDITPAPGCVPNFCFPNVTAHVQQHGGSVQHGWKLWLSADLLEAEFHAVWRSHEGELVEINPDADGETRVLFMADPVRRYDGTSIPNHVVPLTPRARQHVEVYGLTMVDVA